MQTPDPETIRRHALASGVFSSITTGVEWLINSYARARVAIGLYHQARRALDSASENSSPSGGLEVPADLLPVAVNEFARLWLIRVDDIRHALKLMAREPSTAERAGKANEILFDAFPVLRDHNNLSGPLDTGPEFIVITDYGDPLQLRIDMDALQALEAVIVAVVYDGIEPSPGTDKD